jgi:hypothetical protein
MIRGNCTEDENPDAWFPELPVGRPQPANVQELGKEVSRAIILCNSCHRQDECLEEGMQPKNLPYGIWGGKLAGERILIADNRGVQYMVQNTRTRGSRIETSESSHVVIKEVNGVTLDEKRKALSFLQVIKPWIRG